MSSPYGYPVVAIAYVPTMDGDADGPRISINNENEDISFINLTTRKGNSVKYEATPEGLANQARLLQVEREARELSTTQTRLSISIAEKTLRDWKGTKRRSIWAFIFSILAAFLSIASPLKWFPFNSEPITPLGRPFSIPERDSTNNSKLRVVKTDSFKPIPNPADRNTIPKDLPKSKGLQKK